ncbi:MAG: cation transporter [Marmoricola sp.]|nr:cation transporter [Marmoricola sp.]
MGAGHGHGHAAGRVVDRSRLKAVLALTVAVVVVELVGAWVSSSLALLADAGHMVTDAASVAVALSASYVATRAPDPRRTFGLHRAEILAALVNAVVLLGVCGFLAYEGVRRLVDPAPVHTGPMLVFAAVGLLANGVSLSLLVRRKDTSLNMRGAYLEVLGDLVGSGLVVVAALVIMATGFLRADPLVSLVIAVLILPRSVRLLRDAVDVLLEKTPVGLDLDDVRDHLLEVPGVVDVHDLHAWTITSGMPVLSAHVTVTDACLLARGVGSLLDDFSGCVAAHFAVEHVTFQIEPESHREHEDLGEAHA